MNWCNYDNTEHWRISGIELLPDNGKRSRKRFNWRDNKDMENWLISGIELLPVTENRGRNGLNRVTGELVQS